MILRNQNESSFDLSPFKLMKLLNFLSKWSTTLKIMKKAFKHSIIYLVETFTLVIIILILFSLEGGIFFS